MTAMVNIKMLMMTFSITVSPIPSLMERLAIRLRHQKTMPKSQVIPCLRGKGQTFAMLVLYLR
jgi:hypothetical protein